MQHARIVSNGVFVMRRSVRNSSRQRPLRLSRSRVESQLRVEPLEGRIVMTAGITFDARQGLIRMNGTERNDVASIAIDGTRVVASLKTPTVGFQRVFAAASVKSITFTARGGDDSFVNNSSIPSIADGGKGADTLVGGEGRDQLVGGDGNDRILGNGGHDVLTGGAGDDTLEGGDGNDTAGGGPGIDTLLGGAGDDSLSGGDGGDLIDGGAGNDVIGGAKGDDQLYGGTGDDKIIGNQGDDKLWGGAGNDILDSGPDMDVIDGDEGNDRLSGGDGIDHLLGGEGDDWLDGGAGDDNVDGEAGNDVQFGGTGNDLVDGGSGNDTIRGGPGDDRMVGGLGNDWLYGDAGDDQLDGNAGDDKIYGGSGNDDNFDDSDLLDDSPEDSGDNLPSGGGSGSVSAGAASAAGVFFAADGSGTIVGTSGHRSDKQYFSFTAAMNGTLAVIVAKDASGRYAELEIEDATTSRSLLELEPRSDSTNSGRVGIVKGHRYVIEMRSQNIDPVGFVVKLSLLS
jgi:Ca2+-binding RTX toxin-like protein